VTNALARNAPSPSSLGSVSYLSRRYSGTAGRLGPSCPAQTRADEKRSKPSRRWSPISVTGGVARSRLQHYLTASRKALPALNFGVLRAEVKISRPVCGFRPFQAERDVTENVPNPASVMLAPLLNETCTALLPSLECPVKSICGSSRSNPRSRSRSSGGIPNPDPPRLQTKPGPGPPAATGENGLDAIHIAKECDRSVSGEFLKNFRVCRGKPDTRYGRADRSDCRYFIMAMVARCL
jgi:hypothetical protein